MSAPSMRPEHAKVLRFADYLDTIPSERWDFSNIFTGNLLNYVREEGEVSSLEGYCGSVGCAVGHLPFWAESKADGWAIRLKSYTDSNDNVRYELVLHSPDPNAWGNSLHHLSQYFGLITEQVNHIFYTAEAYIAKSPFSVVDMHDVTPQMVAAALREAVGARP